MSNSDLEDGGRDRRSLMWFMAGLAFGVVITLIISAVNTPSPRQNAANAVEIDYEQIRNAAREGAAQAIRETDKLPSNADTTASPSQNVNAATANIQPRPRSSLGSEQAPVVIVEFSDFECSYCRLFYQQTLPRIADEYINSGKVRFSYRHFPVLADSSLVKAEAAECAGEQDRFWDFHNALFSGKVSGQADESALKQALVQLAGELNLDTGRFETCLQEGRYRAQITEDYRTAQDAGVRGTPSFFINGKLLVGAQPLLAFRTEIESALSKQQGQ